MKNNTGARMRSELGRRFPIPGWAVLLIGSVLMSLLLEIASRKSVGDTFRFIGRNPLAFVLCCSAMICWEGGYVKRTLRPHQRIAFHVQDVCPPVPGNAEGLKGDVHREREPLAIVFMPEHAAHRVHRKGVIRHHAVGVQDVFCKFRLRHFSRYRHFLTVGYFSLIARKQGQSAAWSFTMPQACRWEYTVTVPRYLKP